MDIKIKQIIKRTFYIAAILVLLSGCKDRNPDDVTLPEEKTESNMPEEKEVEVIKSFENLMFLESYVYITRGDTYRWEKTAILKDAEGKEITYLFDFNGNMVEKNNNGQITRFYYDNTMNGGYGSGRLIAEEGMNGRIEYLYDTQIRFPILSGFIYQDQTYFYMIDKMDRICGILNENDECIVKYEYPEEKNFMSKVYGRGERGSWIEKASDGGFLGNINKFRGLIDYYEEETEVFRNGGDFRNKYGIAIKEGAGIQYKIKPIAPTGEEYIEEKVYVKSMDETITIYILKNSKKRL